MIPKASKAPGFGSVDKRCTRTRNRRIVVTLDIDQMGEVRAYALSSRQSLGAAVRDLIEWGLEAVET